jgi:RNA polymerase sigma-70 factor (ECF subfamily)
MNDLRRGALAPEAEHVTQYRTMTSDEQLILDFQNGPQAAFAELFDRYRQPVFGFFRRRLRDSARAEEMAQETFLVVLRGIERYEPRAAFRTYLYSIAFKQASGEYRRAKHNPVPISTEPAAAREPDSCDAIWVRRAVEKLDEQHREVLLLREYEQLSYDEIAELLRIPVNTVRSRLFRARMELKALLDPEVSEIKKVSS